MASSSTASSWMPSQGRHPVNIGSSLGRAIKNRKLKGSPAPTTKRSNLPERDFYSFKFNFKASSIDATKPASIEIKKGAENSQVLAEYPSTQSGEAHSFVGIEQTAKDVDCILIYDEDTGQYTLEKLDSFVLLKFNRKLAVSPRPASRTRCPISFDLHNVDLSIIYSCPHTHILFEQGKGKTRI
ncbi:RNA polymerase II transcription elongation factor-domain-containing protein [Flammula alnicola]|nr:RNA polymerase II transcription elongation factor-domain-containing protein [Flammula alnicola]